MKCCFNCIKYKTGDCPLVFCCEIRFFAERSCDLHTPKPYPGTESVSGATATIPKPKVIENIHVVRLPFDDGSIMGLVHKINEIIDHLNGRREAK